MRLRAVLLDLDGTLIDTREADINALVAALREHGFPVEPEEIQDCYWKPDEQVIKRVLARAGIVDEGLARRILRRKLQLYERLLRQGGLRVIESAPRALRRLRRAGLRLALVTTCTKELAQMELELAGMLEFFDALVTYDDSPEPKPSPAPVLVALRRLGVSAAEAIMIGDSEADMIAARRAGVVPLGVLTGISDEAALRKSGAHRVFRSVDEAARWILERLGIAPSE